MRDLHVRVLDKQIANPNADGRKRGWNGAKFFKPGRYLCAGDAEHGIITCIGESAYDRVQTYGQPEAYKALFAATTRVEPEGIFEVGATVTDNFDASGTRAILGVLLKQGAITVEQIRAAATALEADETLYDQI